MISTGNNGILFCNKFILKRISCNKTISLNTRISLFYFDFKIKSNYPDIWLVLRNNSTYFDFQVQTKYKTVRAVCFSAQKRKVLNSFSKTDTPVKLKKCRLETKYNSEDLVLNDDVKIEACSEVDFNKKELSTNFTISTLKSLSTRGPGRRDTCHLTDFSQTFTDD